MRFLETVHPYDSLPRVELERVAQCFDRKRVTAVTGIYAGGELLPGLFLIMDGSVEIRDWSGTVISQLSPRNSFGERGPMADGFAVTSAFALADSRLLILPALEFKRLARNNHCGQFLENWVEVPSFLASSTRQQAMMISCMRQMDKPAPYGSGKASKKRAVL